MAPRSSPGMDRRTFLQVAAAAATLAAAGSATGVAPPAPGPPGAPMPLPPPQTEGGRPLMQALRERRSSRTFRPDRLPAQELSNLLWAAFGLNRPETGGRTAPSANNSQELEIYLAAADGLSRYEPRAHALLPLLSEDLRRLTGRQAYVQEAPLTLVYVSDLSRMTRAAREDREFYAAAHAGFVSQNVYLYCASAGLATVVRALIDRPPLAARLELRPEQRITLAQTVGYPRG